jgi:hypothetical protein
MITAEQALCLRPSDKLIDKRGHNGRTVWVVEQYWQGGFPIPLRCGRGAQKVSRWMNREHICRYEVLEYAS